MDLYDKLSTDPIIKRSTKRLINALEMNLKEDASESKAELSRRICQIVVKEKPNLKKQLINGIVIDQSWTELMRAEPNLFIWFGLIICLFSFSVGWILSKNHHIRKQSKKWITLNQQSC